MSALLRRGSVRPRRRRRFPAPGFRARGGLIAAVVGGVLTIPTSPELLHAQVLTGRLLTAYEDRPIAHAWVRFLDAAGDTLASTRSDEEGWFVLTAPGPGTYMVHASGDLHDAMTEVPLELQAGDTLEAELRLMPRAFEMDPLEVEVEGRDLTLDRVGFYDRAATGLGRFITEEDIARRSALYTADVMSGLPGVLVQSNPRRPGPPGVYLRRRGSFAGGGWCEPTVYIDDVPQMSSPGGSPVNDIRPENVAGIEIYTSQLRVPPQYAGGTTGCGVILIWTKR